jgi:hypothetical protein
MLLISVIKYLIVMPDVKDLAQAAQGAAAASENVNVVEPHPTPPSHSPQTLQCPLSSPLTLSPHSIPLVTSNFISITFCYESKSP